MLHHTPSQAQLEQLQTAFPRLPEMVFEQLVGEPRVAPLPDTPGEYLPYIRPNEGGSTPLLIVPGWGVGRMRRLAFAGALAAQDFDVILPGQNRSYGNPATPAALYHAHNYEAVLEQEGLQNRAVDFVAQSYGCLVLETLVHDMRQKSFGSLKDSTAILMAPMGLVPDPKTPEKAHRFEASKRSELVHDLQDFPDHGVEMLLANTQILLRNRKLSLAEDYEMRGRTLDVGKLCRLLSRVVLVTHKEDRMLPQERIETAAQNAVAAGASWLSPYSLKLLANGNRRGGQGATHNDEQFNPERIVGSIAQILRSERFRGAHI